MKEQREKYLSAKEILEEKEVEKYILWILENFNGFKRFREDRYEDRDIQVDFKGHKFQFLLLGLHKSRTLCPDQEEYEEANFELFYNDLLVFRTEYRKYGESQPYFTTAFEDIMLVIKLDTWVDMIPEIVNRRKTILLKRADLDYIQRQNAYTKNVSLNVSLGEFKKSQSKPPPIPDTNLKTKNLSSYRAFLLLLGVFFVLIVVYYANS